MTTIKRKIQLRDYLSNLTFDKYLNSVRDDHPKLFSMLDIKRLSNDFVEECISEMDAVSWEFEDEEAGGRGTAYNNAQRAFENRQIGMAKLLSIFSDSISQSRIPHINVLDVLAGDGTVARFSDNCNHATPTIISADLSKLMINSCFLQKLPCIRQSATQSFLKDGVLDGGLIAYGSHHLDSQARPLSVIELHRTLKSEGRVIIHDFETGGPFATWFTDVVHPYSRTGHPHPHFLRQEMIYLLKVGKFKQIQLLDMDDRFTLYGETAEQAHKNAIMHLFRMYDLVKIAETGSDLLRFLENLITNILGPIEIDRFDQGFIATIHRTALVVTGIK